MPFTDDDFDEQWEHEQRRPDWVVVATWAVLVVWLGFIGFVVHEGLRQQHGAPVTYAERPSISLDDGPEHPLPGALWTELPPAIPLPLPATVLPQRAPGGHQREAPPTPMFSRDSQTMAGHE